MASRDRQKSGRINVSLSQRGLLALLGGCTLFYLFWQLQWGLTIRSGTTQIAILLGAALMALWGLNELVLSLVASLRGKEDGAELQSGRSSGSRTSRTISMFLSIAAIAGGAVLGVLIALRAESSLTVAVGITAGVLLIISGVRGMVNQFSPSRKQQTLQTRQNLTLPGLAVLGMMVMFLVASFFGRSNMLMVIASLMIGIFICNGWMTFQSIAGLRARRRLPERVICGETIDVDLTLKNRKPWMSSWLLDVSDRITGKSEELSSRVMFVRIPPRGRQHGHYRLRLLQRGRYRFGPVAVNSRFPLGFVERGVSFDAPDSLIVYPRLGRLTPDWERAYQESTELVESERMRSGIYDDEFHRLREYRWGDNPRAIHWRTSARRGDLMVREYQQVRDRDLVIILDLWQPTHPTEADRERVELAVSFVATACIERMRSARESLVSLTAYGNTKDTWRGQAGGVAFDTLLEILALIEPGNAIDPTSILKDATAETSTTARKVIVTTRPEWPPSLPSDELQLAHWERYQAKWDVLGRYFDVDVREAVAGVAT